MSIKRTSMTASALTAALCLSATATFAQSATTFSGEAVALKANAVGIAVALGQGSRGRSFVDYQDRLARGS